MAELIPDQEDREFPSSLGHWEGDFEWSGEEWMEREGYMQILFPPPNQPYSEKLQYPHIKPPADKTLTLHLLMSPCFHSVNLVSYSITLQDGTHTLSPDYWWDEHTETWAIHTLGFTTPDDWDPLNAFLEIAFVNGPWWTTTLRFDQFSLTMELAARKDHLPLMGVH